MLLRRNTFSKMLVFLIAILIPVIVLYAFSNKVSMDVLHSEITSMKEKDLVFFANELGSSLNDISTLGFLLSQDIHIQKIRTLHLLDNSYERYSEKLRILERLQLLNAAGKWDTQYSIISPENGEMVSTSSSMPQFDMELIAERFSPVWEFHPGRISYLGFEEVRFFRHLVQPQIAGFPLERAGLIVEISFSQDELVRDLDAFKLGGNGDPFLISPDGRIVPNSSADPEMTEAVAKLLMDGDIAQYENMIVPLKGSDYLINAKQIPALGWHVVDYVPLDTVTRPIVKSRNLFYGSIACLLVMSIFAAYMLYKNVQRPIFQLIRSVHKLKIGDYTVRLTSRPNNEFTFLFDRFNEMAAEIEQLIQKVYVEQLRSREANLKQLQSQINPHFLYNCFALIRSLTRLGKKDSVMEMALELSKYYRYTTRVEKPSASLQEEVDLIQSYLKIQQLHHSHLHYEIDIPESMRHLEIPRLTLQPLVENAIVHGIEKVERDGIIEVSGGQTDRYYYLRVRDNGAGMSSEQMDSVQEELNNIPSEETGCALWNIKQRIKLQFGAQADLLFTPLEPYGLQVEIRLPISKPDDETQFQVS